MGNLTLSFENEDEKKLRRIAQKKYSGKKGALSKVVSEGLKRLDEDSNRERAFRSLMKKMEKGYDMGKILYKNRGELYDR